MGQTILGSVVGWWVIATTVPSGMLTPRCSPQFFRSLHRQVANQTHTGTSPQQRWGVHVANAAAHIGLLAGQRQVGITQHGRHSRVFAGSWRRHVAAVVLHHRCGAAWRWRGCLARARGGILYMLHKSTFCGAAREWARTMPHVCPTPAQRQDDGLQPHKTSPLAQRPGPPSTSLSGISILHGAASGARQLEAVSCETLVQCWELVAKQPRRKLGRVPAAAVCILYVYTGGSRNSRARRSSSAPIAAARCRNPRDCRHLTSKLSVLRSVASATGI
jgi:hypothetical protein